MVAQDMLFTLWPGKFPQKYARTDILNRGIWMGADGCVWAWMGALRYTSVSAIVSVSQCECECECECYCQCVCECEC